MAPPRRLAQLVPTSLLSDNLGALMRMPDIGLDFHLHLTDGLLIGTYQPFNGRLIRCRLLCPQRWLLYPDLCPIGTYQPSTRQYFCIEADAGHYVPNASAISDCLFAGEYQPLMGQSSCIDADAGYYVPNTQL